MIKNAAVQAEQFLRALVDLSVHDDLGSLLDAALEVLVARTGATLGYVELFHDAESANPPRYARAFECSTSRVESIRRYISRGIIESALASGTPILTSSAIDDERFADHGSVRQNEIKAVLCVPLGIEFTIGVIYLQASTVGRFGPSEQGDVFTGAQLLTRLADQLLARALPPASGLYHQIDALQRQRIDEAIERNGGNKSAAARELGIPRSHLYRVTDSRKPRS